MRHLDLRPVLALLALVLWTGGAQAKNYQPMTFTVQGEFLIADGVIDRSTPGAFERVTKRNPHIKTLLLGFVEGSADDEANVVLARRVRELGFTTLVPSDGLVASGGTDLFLAGVRRILEPGACVGVHSWGASGIVATDLPRKHPEHDRYLDYYEDVGIPAKFYWFTLRVAPAEGMHWMTAAEAQRFDMTTEPVTSLGSEAACWDR